MSILLNVLLGLLGAVIGFTISWEGITVFTWKFWLVMCCLAGIIVIAHYI